MTEIEVVDQALAQLLRVPNVGHETILAAFLLCVMRFAPIVSMAPFLGGKAPGMVKTGIAVVLSLFFLPHVIATAGGKIVVDAYFIFLIAKEFALGFILGLLISIPFHMIQTSGSLIDYMRGSSSLMTQDPTMQTQVSPIGLLFNYVLIVLFYYIGATFLFFGALADSFNVIPVTGFFKANFFSYSAPLWHMTAGLMTKILALAIQLSAPSLLAVLMAEMFLGIANRLAPQVQIAFLGMSLKSLLGLSLLWASWFFVIKQIGNQSISWINQIDKVILSFK